MYVCGSGIAQLSASHGFRLKCSSRRTRESKSSSSMRSDCASTPTRGSRLVGLLSMIITSVLGSGLRVQRVRSMKSPKTRPVILIAVWSLQRPNEVERSLSFADPSSLLRIAHFAQNCGSLCPSCGSNVRRHPPPRLIRQQRKSCGFLRLGGQPKLVGGAHAHLQGCEFFMDHSHQGCIFRPPAGDHELAKSQRWIYQRQYEPVNRDPDGSRSERGCSRNDVVLVGARGQAKKLTHKLAAKLLAAGTLRRCLPEERMAKELLQHALNRLTARSEPPIAIVGAIEQLLRHGVNDHVPGSGIEGDYIFRKRARRNRGEVSDASQVLHNPSITPMAV